MFIYPGSAFPAPKSNHMMTEDSAFSIYFLILRSGASRSDSWAELERWMDRRTGTDLLPFLNLPSLQDVCRDALVDRVRRTDAARLNPFASEFFSQAILRRLGIGIASAEICAADKIPASPGWVVKAVALTGDLKFNPALRISRFVLISRLVENAASVDYVRRKFAPSLRSPFFWRGLGEVEIATIDDRLSLEAARALSKSCPDADELYRDFRPANLNAIREAIRGEKYLRILAARVFVGVSAAHFANVLCTADGDLLISIDHARMQRENGDDLRMLFRFTRRGSRVFDILGEIAKLEEQDIRASVANIPKHPACGSTEGLPEYFAERLQLWKSLYAGAPAETYAVAQAV